VNAQLLAISQKYEIQKEMAKRLRKLQDYEIVIVCDDFGSMKATVNGTQHTRWNELCSIVKIIIEIGVVFDSNGLDIYFLNRKSFRNVKDPIQVDRAFAPAPSGYTPLVPVLKRIFESQLADRGRDKNLLVFIATDGEPTDGSGTSTVSELERLMREKRQADTTYVSFLVCTDDPPCVDYLNQWDQTMANVDVTNDFHTEREKFRHYRGQNCRFTYGDYVVKALIGAIDQQIDIMNEPQ
jgi:hypothetical protein